MYERRKQYGWGRETEVVGGEREIHNRLDKCQGMMGEGGNVIT